ncbi:hypothetical protein BGZ94_004743, partial [Podila epigama]
MRLSAAVVAVTMAVAANAQSAYFPFAPEGPCVAQCNDVVGKAAFPNYNDVDEYGPYFLQSLGYTFNRGSPATIQFMSDTGMCFGRSQCSKEELDAYAANYPTKLVWYQANKDGTPPPRPTTAAPSPTTTVAPSPSPSPVNPAFPFTPNGPCVDKCMNDV